MQLDRRSFLGVSGAAMGCAHAPEAEPRGPDLEIPLWSHTPPGGVPAGLAEHIEHRDNPFGLEDRAAHNVTRPLLSVFLPPRPNGAAILIIPGGGYRWAVIDKEGFEGARRFSLEGACVYVLRYRLPGQGWRAGAYAPLEDAQRAMRLIRARAAREGVDPARIMVMGFSAGGHLAGLLCARHDMELAPAGDEADALAAAPNGAALIYPVASMRAPFAHAGSRARLIGDAPSDDDIAAFSLETLPLDHFPPTFLMHAQDDSAVPVENTLMLHAALRRAGKSAALHLFERGGHGFGLRGIAGQPSGLWPQLFIDWVRAHDLLRRAEGT